MQKLRKWLDSQQISNYKLARLLCKIIPARCPFEQQVKVFNHIVLQIPPLCKFNPFYEELVMLRYKSLVYLADECGVDVTIYC